MDRPLYVPGPRRLPQPRGPAAWGTPMPLLHESIADIKETPFIARVLSDLHHRHTLFNLKGVQVEGAHLRQGVELCEFRKDLAGDIDILVLPAGQPEQATAIQVKRFKVGSKAVRTGKPNRMADFKEGVRQANDLTRLGFSQVYLWVFVLIDTREQNGGRFTYDGPDAELHSRIEHAISTLGLDPRVGLMSFEWVQPIDRPPLELGTFGGHLRQSAQPMTQPAELTHWLRTLGERHGE